MSLGDIRKEIDAVDEQIVKLFLKRMDISKEIALEKEKTGEPVTNPAREREVLERVSYMSGDEMREYTIELYHTLFCLSKAYQRTLVEKGALADE